jgi:hypothetical protein
MILLYVYFAPLMRKTTVVSPEVASGYGLIIAVVVSVVSSTILLAILSRPQLAISVALHT